MNEMTTDLDQGPERPVSYERFALMLEERNRIQALGGTIDSQRWLRVKGRWIIRTHYTMPNSS